MGLFGRKKPAGDPLKGGADGVFDVLGADGGLVRYTPDDFDEIWTTTDEHEAGHHVSLGWLLLDEIDGAGAGLGHEEFRTQYGLAGEVRIVPVRIGPDDVITYVLGYLKPGREGSPSA
jgi:hypothetical protein